MPSMRSRSGLVLTSWLCRQWCRLRSAQSDRAISWCTPRLSFLASHCSCSLSSSSHRQHPGPSNCTQVSDLAAARVRWAAARQSRVDAAESDKKCRAYRIHFYDAVTARQAASICEDGIHRQRDLALLDGEIDAFNSLIAAQCGG